MEIFLTTPMEARKQALVLAAMFNGLPELILDRLAEMTQEKKFSRGEAIFLEGNLCNGFYMVMQGQVKLFKMALNGKEQTLYILEQGEPFGMVPIFHGNAFPASAVSLTASTVLFFPKKDFLELTAICPELTASMMSKLCQRMRRFATQIESLSLKEAPKRLAAHLLYLQKEQGGTDQVLLNISKKQLANLLGTSAETLSRIFNEMSAAKLIEVEGRIIRILDPAALRCRSE
jgi:CRP/FNR family transcriptional regulator